MRSKTALPLRGRKQCRLAAWKNNEEVEFLSRHRALGAELTYRPFVARTPGNITGDVRLAAALDFVVNQALREGLDRSTVGRSMDLLLPGVDARRTESADSGRCSRQAGRSKVPTLSPVTA